MAKTRKLLPKLKKIDYTKKKHRYHINDPFRKRKLAIHEGVNMEAKKTNKTKKQAAIAKKGRFNILRIYRRYKKPRECKIITSNMRYMDKKYGLGKTKNICGGGNSSKHPFILKGGNVETIIIDPPYCETLKKGEIYYYERTYSNWIYKGTFDSCSEEDGITYLHFRDWSGSKLHESKKIGNVKNERMRERESIIRRV